MAEKASWRIGQQTSRLSAVRAEAKGLWRDSAGKFIDSRYLRPHDGKAKRMASDLTSQEQQLRDATGFRQEAATHEKVAVRQSHIVAEELVISDREVSVVYDFVTRSTDFENRAGGLEEQCAALSAQAGSACNGMPGERGGTLDFEASHSKAKAAVETGDETLTSDDEASIRDYTFDGFISMNRSLRGRQPMENVTRAKIEALDKALSKLPSRSGTVYRGVQLGGAQRDRYTAGDVVKETAFTSATFDPARRHSGNTIFVIEAKNAKAVERLSSVPYEKEAIIPRGTNFRVSAQDSYGGIHWFYLEEV